MATTLRDIAAHLNVSQTLVSGVLNNRPNVWASEETRRRIFEAARELDYRPSASARALATGKTRQIAVLSVESERAQGVAGGVPDVRGLVDAAAARAHRVVVLPLNDGSEGDRQLDDLLGDRVCDALCLLAAQATPQRLQIAQKRAIPTAIIGALEGRFASGREPLPEGIAHFDYDNLQMGFNSAKWLLDNGHRRFAWVGANGEGDQSHARLLREGFLSASRQAGVEPLFVPHFSRDADILPFVRDNQITAVMVRYAAHTLQWLFHLKSDGVVLPDDFTVMSLLNESDLLFFQHAGLEPFFACQLYFQRGLEFQVGNALLDWVEGFAPPQSHVTLPPVTPQWATRALNALRPPKISSLS